MKIINAPDEKPVDLDEGRNTLFVLERRPTGAMFKLKAAFETIQSVLHGSHSSALPGVADSVEYLPDHAVIMIHFPLGKSVVIPVDEISELDNVPAEALSSITLSFAGTALTLVDHNIDISVLGLLKSHQGKDGSGSADDRSNGNAAKHFG
ncbi:DUF2442 domain-containing protein [Caballeronia sp. LjRoot29]|uniref:DUF2442 domain-containing protein n=1 Tax=Caballeronia sp. LjRoot29 TaxID=3342315 RepID=UPI003ED0EE63